MRPEQAEGGAGDEVALGVEAVVDGGVGSEEALGGPLGFEALLLALASSDREVRTLDAIVVAQSSRSMDRFEAELLHRGTVGFQPVGDDRLGPDALVAEQLAHKPQRRFSVAVLLHEHVQHLAFVVDRAPQPHSLATDFH